MSKSVRRKAGRRASNTKRSPRHLSNAVRAATTPSSASPLAFLTRAEELQLALAVAVGMAPESFCQDDVKPVVGWAERTRLGSAMLSLALDGLSVPVGVDPDGEIRFCSVDGSLSPDDAKAYRAKLKRLQAGWKLTFPIKFRISGDDDLKCLLGNPEKAALRVAVEAGTRLGGGGDLNEDRMLCWAGGCRNDEILLASILVGDVLPIVAGEGSPLTFRLVKDLPVARQKVYRAQLQQIGAIYQS